MATLASHNTSLSLPARLVLYLGPPATVLLTGLASFRTGVAAPIAFVPAIWFYRKWRQLNKTNPTCRGKLEPILWIFVTVGTIGISTVVLAQITILKGAAIFLFKSDWFKDFYKEFGRTTTKGLSPGQLAHRAVLASTWQNWVFNALLSFVAAGICEEVLKYLPVVYAQRCGTEKERKERKRAYIDYAVAGCLSFTLIENIGFIYAAAEQDQGAWPVFIMTCAERLLMAPIAHLSAGVLSALRATRRDFYGEKMSLLSVLGPSMLLHGLFDFSALSFSALNGNPGWIHPTRPGLVIPMMSLGLTILGGAVWGVIREWKKIKGYEHARKPSVDGNNYDYQAITQGD